MTTPPTDDRSAIGTRRLLLTVMIAQAFYTAGDSISGGKFLTYYVDGLTGSVLGLSLLFVLPELVAVLGILAQPALARRRDPKTVWLAFAIIARLAGLGVAVAGGLPAGGRTPVTLGLVALLEVAQAISYVALIAWLASIGPPGRWGRLFARRGIAISATLAIVGPLAGSIVLERYGKRPSLPQYATILTVGQGIATAGLLIYATLPRGRPAPQKPQRLRPLLRSLATRRSTRRTIATALHLALANGLTQSAFYFYSTQHLGIAAGTAVQMVGLMYAMQIAAAYAGGRLLDRRSNRVVYAASLAVAAAAVPFWFVALWDVRAVWLVYAMWGAFGAVNIAGRTLMLRLVPEEDAAGGVAVFRLLGGLLAGLSGLLGGAVLSATQVEGRTSLTVCLTLIGVSLAGRLTAPLWLLGWSDPAEHPGRSG